MNRLLYLSLAFIAIACNSEEKSTEIQLIQWSDLEAETLFLEKDSLTSSLGSDFTFFEEQERQFISTFSKHQLLTYSFPEGKLI
jgi:hypothetical protein